MKIRTLLSIVIAALIISLAVLPISGELTHADDHTLVYHGAKRPTNYSIGWDAYETCENCDYSTFATIPMYGMPQIENFETFVENLLVLDGGIRGAVIKFGPAHCLPRMEGQVKHFSKRIFPPYRKQSRNSHKRSALFHIQSG